MSKRQWLPLNALWVFEAVAEAKSFTGGAQVLEVAQCSASRTAQHHGFTIVSRNTSDYEHAHVPILNP